SANNTLRKAQYERHFKKWGFQRYTRRENWEAIALKVTKRKRDNKESEVRIDGEVVCVKKLRKELSRYAPTPKTPEGIYVCTPPSLHVNTCLSYNLPWFRFLAMFESKGSYTTGLNYLYIGLTLY
ncbi:hypothetical protein K469DRAFT_610950, partial [Zopfia rhizophila CBS 207.26]